jgi:hypothetical protein
MRVRLDYTNTDGFLAGSRFYLSYAGAAPTGANCITLAGDVEAAWVTHLAPNINAEWALTEVDVLDIATDSGLSGQWNGSSDGTGSGAGVPAQCAINIEYGIARRYRGGKPRMFLPGGSSSQLADAGHWLTSFVDTLSTDVAAFFSELEALSIGAVGTIAHVNLSYYSGFTNVTNSSGRTRAAPKYRALALLDTVVGYAPKVEVGSQRRRRTATTY